MIFHSAAALISNFEKLATWTLSSIFNKAQHNFMPAKKCMPNTSQVFLTRTRWTGKAGLDQVTIWQSAQRLPQQKFLRLAITRLKQMVKH